MEVLGVVVLANVAKYSKGSVGNMFKHYERGTNSKGELVKFKNQEIDSGRSHLNYNLANTPKGLTQKEVLDKRLTEVKVHNRPDVNLVCSWVVTKPENIKPEEQELFFKETYSFMNRKYGEENVVSAYVHLDETTPHMHYVFVPVTIDKKKGIEKVRASDVINRTELKRFHPELEGHMEKVFGRNIGILNDATKEGNKSIEELKMETSQKLIKEIRKFEEFKNTPASTLEELVFKITPKKQLETFKQIENMEWQIKELKTENSTFKNDLNRKDELLSDRDLKIEKLEKQVGELKEKADAFTMHKINLKQEDVMQITTPMLKSNFEEMFKALVVDNPSLNKESFMQTGKRIFMPTLSKSARKIEAQKGQGVSIGD